MATRGAPGLPDRTDQCTEFQLYGGNVGRSVIDFTEKKLLRYVSRAVDPQQKTVLLAMIDDYRTGHIAVAWRRGQPLWLKVTRAI